MGRCGEVRWLDVGSACGRFGPFCLLALAGLASPASSLAPTPRAPVQVSSARAPSSRPRPSLPPRIRTDLAPVTEVALGQELVFRVEARDPDGWQVGLTLLNPPPGLVFDPVHRGRSPAAVEVRWSVWRDSVGPITLVFEARDESGLRTRLERVIETRATGTTGLLTGDVTGDGVLDVVGIAALADVEGVTNAGAIYVWAGASAPAGAPSARLSVPGATQADGLGSAAYVSAQPVKLADVTGDGIDDVIALASEARAGGVREGAIHVFEGGAALAGNVAPVATLTAPGANGLGRASGDGMLLSDLTGDGVLDVVAAARAATVGGVQGAGAIYLFVGGADLRGTRAPQATLSLPGAAQNDYLCHTDGQGLLIGDVTGDGVPDLVAGTPRADVGLVNDAGILAVWAGGGIPAATPSALMTVPGARGLDRLGSQGGLQAVRLADVTDDGILDVIAGACEADVAGVRDSGAIYVFAGGAELAGNAIPRARLRAPNPGPEDRFGPDRAEGFRIADVTGDGLLEVIAVCSEASVSGANRAGALFVFRVGPPTAAPAPPALPNPPPLATLALPDARLGDRLAGSFQRGLYLRDLTGDGILDLVTVSDMEVEGVTQAGAIHVFAGGALTGTVAPAASLTASSAQDYDRLGAFGLRFEDVTCDGTLDLVAISSSVDAGAIRDAGAIHVFAGERVFRGARQPSAILSASEPSLDALLGLHAFADVSGDGVLDVVASARSRVDGLDAVGAIYVFAGPLFDAVEPAAMLLPPDMAAQDGLTARRCVDVTGDGVLDVLGVASTSGLVEDAGTILVFPGGPMSGRVLPAARLASPIGRAGDFMQLAAVADVTGDGVLDVLGGSPAADPGGIRNAGAFYLFPGGTSGMPLTILAVPGALPDDRLGF